MPGLMLQFKKPDQVRPHSPFSVGLGSTDVN